MEENHIIRDLRALTEEFIPSRIIHRDGQLQALRDAVRPVVQGRPGRHAFLFGPPGSGKTCLSLYVLEELKKAAPVTAAYVNCWLDSTGFRILYSLLRGLGAFVHRKGTPTDELLDVFRHKIQGRQSIIVLDEIDQLEDDTILYDLLQTGVGLVLIANQETALYRMDGRVRSRLSSAEAIRFPVYTDQEMVEILQDRVAYGLVPRVITTAQLRMIARLARGDARTALGILSLAAQKAEEHDLSAIPDTFIERSFPATLKDSRKQALERLTPYQQIALDLLEQQGRGSGELYIALNRAVKQQQLEPIEERTYRKQMALLVRKGFVTAQGDGRWRVYALVQ